MPGFNFCSPELVEFQALCLAICLHILAASCTAALQLLTASAADRVCTPVLAPSAPLQLQPPAHQVQGEGGCRRHHARQAAAHQAGRNLRVNRFGRASGGTGTISGSAAQRVATQSRHQAHRGLPHVQHIAHSAGLLSVHSSREHTVGVSVWVMHSQRLRSVSYAQ